MAYLLPRLPLNHPDHLLRDPGHLIQQAGIAPVLRLGRLVLLRRRGGRGLGLRDASRGGLVLGAGAGLGGVGLGLRTVGAARTGGLLALGLLGRGDARLGGDGGGEGDARGGDALAAAGCDHD